ncbi:MAG: hypothetical protein IPP71_22170 [Bacteroidetes bacterium]|nr:hypothetical protein [Bacteroidota bacterium]
MATKIVVEQYGNTCISSSFSGTASFGNFQLTTTNPSDMFLKSDTIPQETAWE